MLLKKSYGLLPVGALFLCSVSLGCDTVAKISFQERDFSSVRASGFVPSGGDCSAMEGGNASFRFVLLADDQTAIRPLEAVSRIEFRPTQGDFGFSDTNLFEVPNISCTDDADCRVVGFECNADDTLGTNRCSDPQADLFLTGVPEFESNVTDNQIFAVLVENSGSLGGFLPQTIADINPSTDAFLSERASDRQTRRNNAISSTIINWEAVRSNAEKDAGRTTLFGLWEFLGTSKAGVTSLTDLVTPVDGAVFTEQQTQAQASKDRFSQVQGTRANVYQGIDVVLDSLADPQYAGYEKTLVVFTDGPDDLRLETFNATGAAARSSELGVRVFIVHLDQALNEETTDLQRIFPDDRDYWKGRQDPCTADSDCKNFEQCRVPQANGSNDPDAGGDTFCMPTRSALGQLGPIDEYANIACETNGGYIYVNDNQTIAYGMEWLPFTLDGLWKADVTLDAFENGTVPEDEYYFLETTFSATVGGTNRVIDLARAGRSTTREAAQDTRSVVYY